MSESSRTGDGDDRQHHLFGQLPMQVLLRNVFWPLRLMERLPQYGDLVKIPIGRSPVYFACHPQVAMEVLMDDTRFDKGGRFWEAARDFVGNGLASCSRAEHVTQRKLLQPEFQRKRVSTYEPMIVECIADTIGKWEDGSRIDLLKEMYEITGSAICSVLFGQSLAAPELADARLAFEQLLGGGLARMLLPAWARKQYRRANPRYSGANQRIAAIVSRAIGTRQEGEQRRALGILGRMRNDDVGRTALTETQLRDQAVTLFLAGADTTARLLAWACYVIASEPRLQRRLQVEVDSVLAGQPARAHHVPQLELTRQVLEETLRLYPPGWIFSRTAVSDTTLCGHRIPNGSTIFCSPYMLHRRTDMFTAATEFDPSRWTGKNPSMERHAGYIPFGGGPRICIGADFGMLESTLSIATILGSWELIDPVKSKARPSLILTPAPAMVRIRHR
ncbi:cytochrome P450 [Nocardia sp. NPDC052316]|uniref:cytochrome P450 n=1 Tax=Nocardia sp. NPDC052316 TaxID=3364329 RepID=UPI0037C8AFD1